MYIKEVSIQNIRSIHKFEMKFSEPAGWHVLIGENGAGKSSVMRAIAAALIGKEEIYSIRIAWGDWLKKGEKKGSITVAIQVDPSDENKNPERSVQGIAYNKIHFWEEGYSKKIQKNFDSTVNYDRRDPFIDILWKGVTDGFSVAYGPNRSVSGGNDTWKQVFKSAPRAAVHLSIFGENIALSEALDWIKELDNRRLREQEEQKRGKTSNSHAANLLQNIKTFVNRSGLLPHEVQFEGLNLDGELVFRTAMGELIHIVELSSGSRSMLCLTFDLIRQLVEIYGMEVVFDTEKNGKVKIELSGIVLIDEVDAHLHAVWQSRIGKWFTDYFPRIQFIVTTHSPLICRACENGSIWRLSSSGLKSDHGEITGLEKKRLIFGNILDAYGTELFGKEPVRSEDSDLKKARLGQLNMLFALGQISKEDELERQELQKILSSDDPLNI